MSMIGLLYWKFSNSKIPWHRKNSGIPECGDRNFVGQWVVSQHRSHASSEHLDVNWSTRLKSLSKKP